VAPEIGKQVWGLGIRFPQEPAAQLPDRVPDPEGKVREDRVATPKVLFKVLSAGLEKISG
jgi:hypothetical protein